MPLPIEAPVSEVDLPVIDISEFPQDLDAQDLSQLQYHPVVAKLRKACKEWGFFLLVNHGIPVDLLEKADNVCRDLLSMPTEIKDRAITSNPFDTYYRSPNFEAFRIPDSTNPDSFEQMCAKICPEGNPNFCETMATYSLSVSNIAQKITKLILASLGLDPKTFYHSHFEKGSSILRINGYSSENKSTGEEAIYSHRDSGCLTILYQDGVGGLQIRSPGAEWLNVKPLSHSFVINVGDSLKAWCNGRYRSAEHRVVYKGWKDRMSIVFFTVHSDDTEILAPAELVDDNNPRRYKPVIYSHLKHAIATNKGNADVLERIAGI